MRGWLNLKASGAAAIVTACALLLAGCQQQQQAPTTTNTNNTNANATPMAGATANMNANGAPETGAASEAGIIQAREPEKYRATLVFTQAETGGTQQKAVQLPSVQIARDGDKRRYAISSVPMLGEVVFVDRPDKRYLILPGRKQYVEVSEMTGFNIRSLSPGQMVEQLQRQPGATRVGEETLNGREVVKYRFATNSQTGTQAGAVQTENFIYVDKETGLPLRIEGYGQSTGNVRGVSSGRIVAEMRDIQTEVEPTVFDLPQGYAQITQDQVKQQIQVIATLFQAFMGGAAGGAATPTP
ncbi:MAG: hypothetical protein ACRD9R_21530, partial [Pyrinomonadaceae bacterium]